MVVGLMLLHTGPLLAADLLAWVLPPLTNPITVNITKGKSYYGPFPNQQDVILRMPEIPVTNMFQPQGDIGKLRIDHLTGTSNYQGLFLRPEFLSTSATIKNVNLSSSQPPSSSNVSALDARFRGLYQGLPRFAWIGLYRAAQGTDGRWTGGLPFGAFQKSQGG